MKKIKTALIIVLTVFIITISTQPAMSHNTENVIFPGAVLGLVARTLIASQAGFYPNPQFPPFPRQAFCPRPVVVVPSPAFGPGPVVIVPQPRWYEEQHRQHRPHRRPRWNRYGERVRW